MNRLKDIVRWLEENRTLGYDLLRAYLGIGLMVRGALFIAHPEVIATYLRNSNDWFFPMVITHYIALAHLGGGALLAAGLETRLAALMQIPPLIGAVFFVHMQDGLLGIGQSLEFAALVFAMLTSYLIFGAGKFSADYYLETHPAVELEEVDPDAIPDSVPATLPNYAPGLQAHAHVHAVVKH